MTHSGGTGDFDRQGGVAVVPDPNLLPARHLVVLDQALIGRSQVPVVDQHLAQGAVEEVLRNGRAEGLAGTDRGEGGKRRILAGAGSEFAHARNPQLGASLRTRQRELHHLVGIDHRPEDREAVLHDLERTAVDPGLRPADPDLQVRAAEQRLICRGFPTEFEGHEGGELTELDFTIVHIEKLGGVERETTQAVGQWPGGGGGLVAISAMGGSVDPFLDRPALSDRACIQPHVGGTEPALIG